MVHQSKPVKKAKRVHYDSDTKPEENKRAKDHSGSSKSVVVESPQVLVAAVTSLQGAAVASVEGAVVASTPGAEEESSEEVPVANTLGEASIQGVDRGYTMPMAPVQKELDDMKTLVHQMRQIDQSKDDKIAAYEKQITELETKLAVSDEQRKNAVKVMRKEIADKQKVEDDYK